MPPIIDMRCRPAFLHDFFGRSPGTPDYETVKWLNRRVGTRGDVEHFTRSATPEGFLSVVKEAGLARAVVVGRRTPSQHLPNDEIARIVSTDPVFLGIGSADPVIQGAKAATAEAERAVKTLGLKGIDVEPGFGSPARHADDIAYFPLYEFCQDIGIPVFLMSGPTTPNPRYNDPGALGNLARQFPRLKLAAYHGYWPNVQEALGVAFRHENVSLIPDMYLFQVGSRSYAEAANSFLGEQLLFGSSYPFRPINQSIEDASQLGLKDEALANFFHRNAERLLGL